MSLNKFTDTKTGLDLKLDIGCDQFECNEFKSNGDVTIVSPNVLYVNNIDTDVKDTIITIGATNATETKIGSNEELKITTGVDLKNSVSFLNVPFSSSAGSFYQKYTSVGNTWTGFDAPQAYQYGYCRVGAHITLSLGTLTAPSAGGGVLTSTLALPVDIRPISDSYFPILVRANGVNLVGALKIATTGIMTISQENLGGLVAGSNGFAGVFVCYLNSTGY
jgi:hypothetical protein